MAFLNWCVVKVAPWQIVLPFSGMRLQHAEEVRWARWVRHSANPPQVCFSTDILCKVAQALDFLLLSSCISYLATLVICS